MTCAKVELLSKHQKILGDNGRELSKIWTWEKACQKVAEVYQLAMQEENRPMFIDVSSYTVQSEHTMI
jgi:hypothetical protein